ncbi:MAG TPA: hypothetical protein VIZ28_07935 [Chitinophagaceae bacterium]
MKKMKVYIDPRTNIVYASYYIHGLYEIAGRPNVRFSIKPFKGLPKTNGLDDFDHYFSFTIHQGDKVLKVVIDFRDKVHLNQTALSWCDVYGKVNYNQSEIDRTQLSKSDRNKIMPVGTNFGIKIWNPFLSGYYLLRNYLRCGFSPGVSFSSFLQGYRWQMKRAGIRDYKPEEAENGYVFFISTLWKNDKNNDDCNKLRAQYIRSCRSQDLTFEGGLFTENKNAENGYADIVTNQFIHHTDYITRIKKSMVTFSTPAVWGCHGWKLGEFLAMGKAIISSTFQNEMPVPLKHGQHIHFVNNEKELNEAVQKITTDKAYRETLEKGAATYYQEYIQPAVVISKLMKHHLQAEQMVVDLPRVKTLQPL